jgi:hypothetical protein
MRDRSSQQFVYETRAVIVSRWTSEALLPALFEAALKDFPQPALSPRSVTIVLPNNWCSRAPVPRRVTWPPVAADRLPSP